MQHLCGFMYMLIKHKINARKFVLCDFIMHFNVASDDHYQKIVQKKSSLHSIRIHSRCESKKSPVLLTAKAQVH